MLSFLPGLLAAIAYDPIVHVELGPLRVSPHGVGIAIGFLAGARLMLPAAARKGIGDEVVYALLVRAAVGAMVGARLAYVANHLGDYADEPLSILQVWEGGISLLGGIFGAMLAALPVMRRLRVDLWRALDAAAPGIALGIVIGRIGDLVVGDHLGKPTSVPFGYRCPDVDTASPCVGEVVHQTALYDLVLTALLLVLLLVLRRRPRWDGFLIVVFGAWYAVGRLVEDFLREDVRRLGLTGSQWTALATLLVCATWLLAVRRTPRWGHWAADDGTGGPAGEPTMTPGQAGDAAAPTVPVEEEP